MPIPSSGVSAKGSFLKKKIVRLAILSCSVLLVLFLWAKLSPLPATLFYRYIFNKEGKKVNAALDRYLPGGLTEQFDLVYDATDRDGRLDLFYPAAMGKQKLALIIWAHGGGLISGSKEQLRNYCRILAGKGFAVASVDYAVAPRKRYPTPVIQVNAALAYLLANAGNLPIDTSKIFLAGDSGGSHIMAQVAAGISDPAYAAEVGFSPALLPGRLAGLVLFCGPYDTRTTHQEGAFGHFMHTVLWTYSGTKAFSQDPHFKTSSVIDYIGKGFPAAFISAGNGDPLLPQSEALARKLGTLQVPVDTLFFAKDRNPPLPHEYQFNLDSSAAREALDRVVGFIHKRAG
ncbi:alpha/beta hydrolase [Flavihumibacter fluvii]|uniref:alpha/beta hydrolase n=1 Tax=Flavihumibacter fluvii TaxID=2838157 RepID=UPI001BDECF86|nr:alpha/beta hydrolase [Flavihumibacter fluvii]ULQ52200.1 alpha/beta hydrolase [Flavihumibacter fluvii]